MPDPTQADHRQAIDLCSCLFCERTAEPQKLLKGCERARRIAAGLAEQRHKIEVAFCEAMIGAELPEGTWRPSIIYAITSYYNRRREPAPPRYTGAWPPSNAASWQEWFKIAGLDWTRCQYRNDPPYDKACGQPAVASCRETKLSIPLRACEECARLSVASLKEWDEGEGGAE